jgi:Cft2 family RNA processing exonuclease
VIFDDGALKVTAFRTKHCAVSYSYLVEAEGKRILFSGDLSKNPSDDFPHAVLDLPLDLAILESAHFTPKEYINILSGKDVKRVCFNHYSRRWIEDIGYTIKALESPVILATDGLEFTL